jgi:hypothetical protein
MYVCQYEYNGDYAFNIKLTSTLIVRATGDYTGVFVFFEFFSHYKRENITKD